MAKKAKKKPVKTLSCVGCEHEGIGFCWTPCCNCIRHFSAPDLYHKKEAAK